MATAYPGALDTTGSQQRTDIASTDDLDASGKEHDVMHVNHAGALVALETKLGIGASAASGATDGDALTKQADGSTAWEAVSAGVSWSGSTANGLATYGSSSSVVSESTATYDATTLELTTSGGGLKLDGLASSDAHTLDDYEEGTWTPVLTAVTSGTITLNSGWNTGGYVKVGRMVTVFGQFYVDSVSSPVGLLYLGGLPFTTLSMTAHAEETVSHLNFSALATSDLDVCVWINNSGAATCTGYGTNNKATGGYQTTYIAPYIQGSSSFGVGFSYPAA